MGESKFVSLLVGDKYYANVNATRVGDNVCLIRLNYESRPLAAESVRGLARMFITLSVLFSCPLRYLRSLLLNAR